MCQKAEARLSFSQPNPSLFWDGLSKIWLTKDALRELDRRNSNSIDRFISRPTNRPATPTSLTKRPNRHQRKQKADVFLHDCTLESLKTIKRFARNGGTDLCDLRGYPDPTGTRSFGSAMTAARSPRRSKRLLRAPASPKRRSRPTTTNPTTTTYPTTTTGRAATKSSRPKDANYQQKLIDGHVFPYGYKFPDGSRPPLPNGWRELNERLAQPRRSLSPSTFPEEKYQSFIEEDASALNEDAVKDTVLPAMLRTMGAADGAQKNVWFNNMVPLVPGISQAKPDYYHGAQSETIHQQVREDLGGYIVPSTTTHFPAVPNFSMEVKGPLGTSRELLLQVCNSGSIGARAMHMLENYRQDAPEYHGKVSSISSTYTAGTLKIYGHSVVEPDSSESQPRYYMHQLRSFSMSDSKDVFLQGATVFKNARDWTGKSRTAAIRHANAIAATCVEEDQGGEEGEEEEE